MSDNTLKQWLCSREAQPILEDVAESIRDKLRKYPGFPAEYGRNVGKQRLALLNEVWMTLCEKSTLASLGAVLEAGDATLLRTKIENLCWSRFKDKYRDPIYRYVREVLQESSQQVSSRIHTKATALGSWFACGEQAPDQRSPEILEGNYRSWPKPEQEFAENSSKKDIILGTAPWFWNELCVRLGRECFIPVRELARYLRVMFPHIFTGQHAVTTETDLLAPGSGDESGALASKEWLESLSSVDDKHEDACLHGKLAELAESLCASLTLEQRASAFLYHKEDLPLREVAQRLGYKSPQNVAYHLNTIANKFKDFKELCLELIDGPESVLAQEFAELVLRCCQPAVAEMERRLARSRPVTPR